MAANMYRVGDYVYFENSSSNPYLVRRIEELNKTANGNVEAKVVCLFRRRDISSSLNSLADSNAREFEEESKQPGVSEQQRHQLKHRELFLSRQFESLPATHIRGKCSVTLLNETDILNQYLEKEVRRYCEKREGKGCCPLKRRGKGLTELPAGESGWPSLSTWIPAHQPPLSSFLGLLFLLTGI